jgi:predicted nucleotidyltransferase
MKTQSSQPITQLHQVAAQVREHPYPLLFATVSGAHLYGFPSPNSDVDLRGVHCLPLELLLGLQEQDNTVEKSAVRDGLEIDLVTHDAKKFFGLLLKRNGYVLEQLLSPLVVFETPYFAELKSLAAGCITRHHAHHYLGFAQTQWKLFQKEVPPRVKPLLYVYRVLKTGIHLMQSGELNANLDELNELAPQSFITDLIETKCNGSEHETIDANSIAFHSKQFEGLVEELQNAYEQSSLPDTPTSAKALNDLLLRIRKNAP